MVRDRPTARALAQAAREALGLFGISPRAQMKRLQDGENTTWQVQPPARRAALVLRLHRANYQPPARIEGELAWLDALAADLPGLTPRPRRSPDGRRLVRVVVGGVEQARPASLLSWTKGRFAPWPGSPNALFQFGELAAKLHRQSRAWRGQAKRRRPSLGFDEHVGDACHWGIAPLAVPALRRSQRDLLAGTIRSLRRRIEAWDRGSSVRGLIHADLHFGNVLFAGGVARAIDFDDCARTWFMMDPAVTLLSAALQDGYARRVEAFWSGYEAEGGIIKPSDHELLPSFHLVRLITMSAWSWTRRDNAWIKKNHPNRQRRMLAACRAWTKSGGVRIR